MGHPEKDIKGSGLSPKAHGGGWDMSKPALCPIMETGELRDTPKARQGPGIHPQMHIERSRGEKTTGRYDPKKTSVEELKRVAEVLDGMSGFWGAPGLFWDGRWRNYIGSDLSEVPVNKRMKMRGPWGAADGAQGSVGILGTQGSPEV